MDKCMPCDGQMGSKLKVFPYDIDLGANKKREVRWGGLWGHPKIKGKGGKGGKWHFICNPY